MLPINKPKQDDFKPLARQMWYDKLITVPGIGYVRNACFKVNEVWYAILGAVLVVVGFIYVCHNESGWKTIVIKDVTRPQIFKLHSVFSFFPTSQRVYAVGNLKGKIVFQQGVFPDQRTYSETVNANGWFYCDLRSGDWYSTSYVHYMPVEIKKDMKGRNVGVWIHYKYEDFWDVLMWFF